MTLFQAILVGSLLPNLGLAHTGHGNPLFSDYLHITLYHVFSSWGFVMFVAVVSIFIYKRFVKKVHKK